MSKVTRIAASAMLVPFVITGIATAAPAGQIEGGDIYRVRNVTKNTDFTDPATADKCETVQFKVRIHNPGPDALTGVKVKATLNTEVSASHSSQVTVSATNANPATTTDTAGVKLTTAAGMNYVAGSTELLDANNAKLSNLPDGILSAGVDVPNGVGVSTQQKRFVQFQAKVDCPTTPPVTPPTTPPATPNTPATPANPGTPTTLPNTGAGSVLALFAAVTAVGAIAYRKVLAARLSQ